MVISNSTSTAQSGDSHDAPRRTKLVSDCLKAIQKSVAESGEVLSGADKTALERAKQQLAKLDSLHRAKQISSQSMLSPEDEDFATKFLEVFTTEAFSEELDNLRQSEGENMSDSDFATLADSIKSFGLNMSEENRDLFNRYLDSR